MASDKTRQVSIRLSEETRGRWAAYVGRTGLQPGDALASLLDCADEVGAVRAAAAAASAPEGAGIEAVDRAFGEYLDAVRAAALAEAEEDMAAGRAKEARRRRDEAERALRQAQKGAR